jgi:hypothetical protein
MTAAARRAALVAAALLIAAAGDVVARGGGARGGGARGGGGFSRGGGAAGGGSFGQRPQAAGGWQRGGYQRNGPAASGTFAGRSDDDRRAEVEARQAARDEALEQRREEYRQRAEARQAQVDDAREAWQGNEARGEEWQDYAEDHDDDWDYGDVDHPYAAAVVAGAAVAAPPYWTLACVPETLVIGGTTYYRCGSAWYVRVYSGGEVAYTMVNPPAGY